MKLHSNVQKSDDKTLWNVAPAGGLTYLAERGCAALMGRFFTKKSLNMVPFFTQKNP